jgi:hypothetical protein
MKKYFKLKSLFGSAILVFLLSMGSLYAQQPALPADSIFTVPDIPCRGGTALAPHEQTIHGRVIDKKGKGVPDVTVSILSDTAMTTTNNEGYFRVINQRFLDKAILVASGSEIKQEQMKTRFKGSYFIAVQITVDRLKED